MTIAWSKNKKGAALIYAVMVLLLLSTVIVAMAALSTASYTDAVLSASDDQSYYYAKSIGLAVKEQFIDGYNINRIITELDRQEADLDTYPDPQVNATFTITGEDSNPVSGTLQIRYARDAVTNEINDKVIEVRAACVINNSVAAVTSIFSCETDSDEESDHLKTSLSEYDVILTDTKNLNFDFTQASEANTGTSNLSVYVYAGEDDSVDNPEFSLRLDMNGKLTTTGKTTIVSRVAGTSSTKTYHAIKGNLTAYGDVTLDRTGVDGTNGIHCDGNVTLGTLSYVKNDIYARGTVKIQDPTVPLNLAYVISLQGGSGALVMQGVNEFGLHSARNIYAMGKVEIAKRAWVTGSIYTHGDVTVTGKGATPGGSGWWNDVNSDHYGNTIIEGSIYSEGDVTISKGAIVGGNVIANGNVRLEQGAYVVGNVQSLNGGVEVYNSVVGGQVNCPNGTLTLNNDKNPSASTYLVEADDPSYLPHFGGSVILGGIGCFRANYTTCQHTCNKLEIVDADNVSVIWGRIYVANALANGFTPLLSVWIQGSIYLENSIAAFQPEGNKARKYYGKNSAGNPYTYIVELNQKKDLYNKYATSNEQYMNLYGAHILTMNIGENKDELFDARIENGWIGNVNARSLYLCDVQVDDATKIYASKYLYIWGSKGNNTWTDKNYSTDSYYTRGFSAPYLYAQTDTLRTTVIPASVRIDVACDDPNYSGTFTSESKCGFFMGVNCTIYGEVRVGASNNESKNAYVILGDESATGPTKFLGTMHAYVGSLKVTASTYLSTVKASASNYTAAKIYAEIITDDSEPGYNSNYDMDSVRPEDAKNSFYVEKSSSSSGGEYRWGSTIQVKGNAYVAGHVYDFAHLLRNNKGNFTNTSDARFKGKFESNGKTLNISGTACFTEIHATNASSTTTMKGSLTVNVLRLNGAFKMESTSHTLTVKGDMYVGNMATPFYSSVSVLGNVRIEGSNSSSPLDPQRKFEIEGDLYIGKNSIKLNKSSYSQYVKGTVEMGGGNLTLAGGAYVGGAKTSSDNSLIIENGCLKGDFDVGSLSIAAGSICSDTKYADIVGIVRGTFKQTGGALGDSLNSNGVYMKVQGAGKANDSVPAVWISGSSGSKATGYGVFIEATNGGAKVEGGSNVSYTQGGLITKADTLVAGGFECGISVSEGNLTIGSATNPKDSYQVGCSYYPNTDEEGNAVKTDDNYRIIYAKGNIEWLYDDAHAMTSKGRYGGWTHLTAEGYVKMGDSNRYIGGRFDQICSKNSYVNLFVSEVGAVVAKTNSWVHTSKAFGTGTGSSCGAKITNGDLYIYGKTGRKDDNRGVANAEQIGEYIRGYFQVSGYIHIETNINAEGASFGCKDVYGLDHIHKYNHLLDISLSLSDPAMSGGYYVLKYPIKGKFTLNRSGNLRYGGNDAAGDPLTIKGEIYVAGIVEFNGSTVDLECFGGLHCLNERVTVRSDFSGNVDLPNVTTLVMNADIGVKAPKVTSFEVSMNLSRSLNLDGCDEIKINAGYTIGGSVIISKTGKIVNNGTINESVKCGVYEGSGVVKKDIITQTGGAENKITGSGYVTGKIWTNGKLTIDSTGTFGSYNSYIYAAGDISITNARFATNMDYILTTGGYIYMKNCRSIPKVYNTKGYIRFVNDSSHETTIASVLSYGTFIDFGDNDDSESNTYQTVTGDLEWDGYYDGNAVDFRNGEHTVVEGVTRIIGTGNVALRKATLATLHLFNKGKVTSTGGGSITKNLYIGAPVTEVTINKTVKGDVTCSASDSKPDVTLSEVDGTLKAYGCNSLTVTGELKKSPTFKSAGTVTLEKKVSGTIYCSNSNLYVQGNVDGAVNAFSPDFSSQADMKVVALGTQLSMITVNGDIKVHGRLVDNSQQIGTARKIYCKGAYYADLQKEFNDGKAENGKGCTQFNFTSQAGGRCYILGSKGGDYTVYNTVFNIDGHLSIYTFYNESTGKYYQMTFNKAVTCRSLIVNSNCPSTTSSTATASGAPTRKIGFYGKTDRSDKAKGIDKKCWFENFETYIKLDIYYTNDTYAGKCTDSDRMYFKGKVNVKGVCIASHTKFGSQLNTEGQVSLAYCSLFSAGYGSDTNHCSYSENGNGIKVADDGAFLHTTSSSGENYFNNVKTYSNVAVYNGVSHIFGGSVFKGTVYAGSSNEVSYKGHRSTKLFYFGDSVELYGGSSIFSAMQGSSYLAAGRTIVWVKKGALVVRDNSFIGDKAYKKGAGLETKDYSQHPGVFVSDTGTGTVSIGGTSYNSGSVYVKGKDSTHPSSITLDICACREIRTTNYGVVVAKCGSSDWQQYSGLYLTKGTMVEESNGWIQVWHDTSDRYGERHYWTGVSDSSAYVPNGSKYLSYFNTQWKTYKKNFLGAQTDTHTRTYSQTQAQLTQCYTPKSSAPSVASPTGVEIDSTTSKNMTFTFPSTQINVTDPSIKAKPSAPSAPSISASGGFNTQGDASVSAFNVKHETTLDTVWAYAMKTSSVSAASVAQANKNLSYSGGKASSTPRVWSYPNFTPSSDQTTIVRPSSRWTASVSEHFDKTQTKYWNTRYIPYVWKLPYEGTPTSGPSGATPAKRVLSGKTGDAKVMNGEFDLTGWTQNEAEGKEYYVNANHYTGSNLEKKASEINGWRSKDIGNNKLWDYVGINCKYDPDRHSSSVAAYYYLHGDPDEKRRSKLFIFESGELPYSAFYMDQGDDRASNLGVSKKIREQNQVGWYWGSSNMSYYDISMVFYTCVDPTKPYTSEAKDLHVVLPQGIALRFFGGQSDYPLTNTVTVVGNGRVFLYLTSGDTIYFKSNAVYESESGALWWKNTTYKSIYANPVGGMKKNSNNKYEPLLYIIGAGTNIDLIIEDMPLAAAVYMPFGSKTEVYSYSSGSLKKYNTFKNATGGSYSSPYSGNGETTSVARNRLKLIWNEANHVGLPRWIYGPIVADNLDYSSASSSYHLNFKNQDVVVNLSNTTIYGQSTTSNRKNGGKTYPMATFLSSEDAPGYSTAYLNWSYTGIKVEG